MSYITLGTLNVTFVKVNVCKRYMHTLFEIKGLFYNIKYMSSENITILQSTNMAEWMVQISNMWLVPVLRQVCRHSIVL